MSDGGADEVAVRRGRWLPVSLRPVPGKSGLGPFLALRFAS